MQKRISLIAMVALAVIIFLIWTDPSGTADVFARFFGAIGGFVKELGHRAAVFLEGLGWK